MGMLPDRIRVSKILSVFAVLNYSHGFSPHAPGSKCTERQVVQPALMTNGRGEAWKTSARGFLDATCLGLCAGRGGTICGKDGGGRNTPTKCQPFYLTPIHRSPLEGKA